MFVLYRFYLKDWYVYTLCILSTISPSISSGNSVGCCSSHISSYCSFSELVHSCHKGSSVDGMVTEGWNSRLMSSWWSRHSHSAGGVGYKLIDLFIFLYAWCRADGPTLAGYYIDYIGVSLDGITHGLAECEGQATALVGEPLGDVGLEV